MSTEAYAAQSWSGRIEDDPLLRGLGRFGDNLHEANCASACFVRSPHAFAKLLNLDTAAARRAPGVIAVFTGADLRSAGYGSVTGPYPLDGSTRLFAPYRPALATEQVMHVGEPVAVVIGRTLGQAQDAAWIVDYTDQNGDRHIETFTRKNDAPFRSPI